MKAVVRPGGLTHRPGVERESGQCYSSRGSHYRLDASGRGQMRLRQAPSARRDRACPRASRLPGQTGRLPSRPAAWSPSTSIPARRNASPSRRAKPTSPSTARNPWPARARPSSYRPESRTRRETPDQPRSTASSSAARHGKPRGSHEAVAGLAADGKTTPAGALEEPAPARRRLLALPPRKPGLLSTHLGAEPDPPAAVGAGQGLRRTPLRPLGQPDPGSWPRPPRTIRNCPQQHPRPA